MSLRMAVAPGGSLGDIAAMQRWGFTFPFDGLPLHAHKEALQEAERLGYTDAWSYEIDGVDCFTPLAMAAAWTERMRLGTAIANVYTRAPLTIAISAMGVAEAAPGRFALGLGAGSSVIVERWGGVPFELPYRKVRDVAQVVRAMFSGEKVSEQLETARTDGAKLSRTLAEAPPIYIAALRKNMLEMAGATADGVIINWLSAGDVPKVVAAARAGAEKAGRDPEQIDVVARIFVCMSEDDNVIDFVGRRAVAAYLNVPVYAKFHEWLGRSAQLAPMWEAWSGGDRKAATAAIPRQVIDDLFIHGDAATCRRKVQEYVDNGVTTPVINFMALGADAKARAEQSVVMLRALAPQ